MTIKRNLHFNHHFKEKKSLTSPSPMALQFENRKSFIWEGNSCQIWLCTKRAFGWHLHVGARGLYGLCEPLEMNTHKSRGQFSISY